MELGSVENIFTKTMSFCCRRDNNYDGLDEPNTEQSPLRSNGGALVDGVIASRRSATDDLNLWTNPDDVSHVISEDDRQLAELLDLRRKSMSREEEMLYHQKIEEIRKVRKKVQDRWKRVLSELGFADEQDKLVAVSSVTRTATPNTSVRAYNLHDKLANETSIFGDAPTQRHRYAVILDRLIDLDITEDFLEAANELYPKKKKKSDQPGRRRSKKSRGTRARDKKSPDENDNENEEEEDLLTMEEIEPITNHPAPGKPDQPAPATDLVLVSAEVHEEPR